MNLSIPGWDAKIQDLTPSFEPRWAPLPDELNNPARHANRLKKEKTALSKRLEALEDEIVEREDEKARLGAALCDPESHARPERMKELAVEMAAVEEALAALMESWENLSGEIEALDEALESIADR